MTVTPDDIRAAADRIRGHVAETPLLTDEALSDALGHPVLMKCEHRQPTGAFKLRGATNALMSLREARGVITASTGNHGRALAHAARALAIPATVCLSRLVPENKIAAIRALGATVRITGNSQDDAMAHVAVAVAQEGLCFIPPFDHPDVVAGQGTIGLEIGTPDAVLVPLSGGGLAAGIAVAIKAMAPATRVVGVSMANGAAMAASLRAGRPVEVAEVAAIADSLGGGIGLANRVTFPLCRDLLDEVIVLSEAEIVDAIRHLGHAGHTVEGAAAVGHGALLSGRFIPRGPTVTILSGGNIDPALHDRIMQGRP